MKMKLLVMVVLIAALSVDMVRNISIRSLCMSCPCGYYNQPPCLSFFQAFSGKRRPKSRASNGRLLWKISTYLHARIAAFGRLNFLPSWPVTFRHVLERGRERLQGRRRLVGVRQEVPQLEQIRTYVRVFARTRQPQLLQVNVKSDCFQRGVLSRGATCLKLSP